MRVLALAALMAAGPAFADYELKIDGGSVRLMDAPCGQKVKSLLQPKFHDRFKAAVVILRNRSLQACWIVSGPGEITLIDQEGDGATLPMAAFSKAEGV